MLGLYTILLLIYIYKYTHTHTQQMDDINDKIATHIDTNHDNNTYRFIKTKPNNEFATRNCMGSLLPHV